MTAKELMQSLLQAAVQGKLVAQDPNDEPASNLLERIRKDKKQLIKAKKIKAPKQDSIIYRKDDGSYYELIGKDEKCIDEEIPFDIPASWEWVRLGSISEYIQRGKSPKYSSIEKYPVIAQKCNQWAGFSIEKAKFIGPETLASYTAERILKDDDLLWNSTGLGTVGRMAIYKSSANPYELAVADGHVTVIRLMNSFICNQFIYSYIASPAVQLIIESQTSGSTKQKELNLSTVISYLVPVPPLSEQKRIVSKIEELKPLIDKYDTIYTALDALDASYPKLMKQSLLQDAIQGKLVPQNPEDEPASKLLEKIQAEKQALIKAGKLKPSKFESTIYQKEDGSYYERIGKDEKCIDSEIPFPIPQNWAWARLGNVGDWKAGSTPNRGNSAYYTNGQIPWLKTGDLTDDYILNIPENITQVALDSCSLRLNPAGAVLIAMYGATIGKLGILTYPATTNQACCACETSAAVYNLYLFYFLMAWKVQFVQKGEGGAQPNISKEKIVTTLLPLPPIEEQHRIVLKIDELYGFLSIIK